MKDLGFFTAIPTPELDECRRKPSNYDRIISKTPEGLAEWFYDRAVAGDVGCPPQHGHTHCLEPDGCRVCWFEWLRKEADV